jgi:hypothetical protein
MVLSIVGPCWEGKGVRLLRIEAWCVEADYGEL